jgi:hypothetical protein
VISPINEAKNDKYTELDCSGFQECLDQCLADTLTSGHLYYVNSTLNSEKQNFKSQKWHRMLSGYIL